MDVNTVHEKYLLRESSQRLASGLTLVSIPPKEYDPHFVEGPARLHVCSPEMETREMWF